MKTKLMIMNDGTTKEVSIDTPCRYIGSDCYELTEEIVLEIKEASFISKKESARQERISLLAETDYLMLPDNPKVNSEERLGELKSYRQALRDLPKQVTSLDSEIIFPTKPNWL